jgi:protein gp37
MAEISAIEWTNATWNPVTGCTKISHGCRNCYAERMARRLYFMGQERYQNGFKITLHQDLIEQPLLWKKPKYIFVNSMSDLFHEDVPTEFIKSIFHIMVKAKWHIFQILTKRSERLLRIANDLPWAQNIWMGVSVESQDYIYRIDHLRNIPANKKFISIEPMLSPISQLALNSIDWVIVGGESGPGARPIKPEWVRTIRDQCLNRGVSFFFKQWGGAQKARSGRMLDGRTWDEIPFLTSECGTT